MSEKVARPVNNNDREGWKEYWKAQGMPWRTEPEIDMERQRDLSRRLAIPPDIERGIYPFRDENGPITLSRADVEWLLAHHESGGMYGPVDWTDKKQRKRIGLDLRGANLRKANLSELPLACLRGGLNLEEYSQTDMYAHEAAAANFREAKLTNARLESASLIRAHFEDADLGRAILWRALLRSSHLEGAYFGNARVQEADFRRAYFSASTVLERLSIGANTEFGSALVSDVRWDSVNLAVISWSEVRCLGDEQVARTRKTAAGKAKDRATRLTEYRAAVRANRQLAAVIKSQGLNEDADRFTYRAQSLERELLLREGKLGQWLFAWLLWLLAGYGYRFQNILITYILTLTAFALVYYFVGLPNDNATTPLQHIADAYQVSITALHGRTFFEQFGIGSTLAWVAAAESVCGLVIEAIFTSMLVQRFFAR